MEEVVVAIVFLGLATWVGWEIRSKIRHDCRQRVLMRAFDRRSRTMFHSMAMLGQMFGEVGRSTDELNHAMANFNRAMHLPQRQG